MDALQISPVVTGVLDTGTQAVQRSVNIVVPAIAVRGNGMELSSLPCGCENRKEIMGAGEWQRDALVLGVAVLIVFCIIGVKGLR